ncbi:MAG: hypothetical protein F4X56_00970 [Gammaproteobacteria bacterium]|nr:hypothetical protein [Gammaproteobacteria bacterium]MYC24472.1 hypothetical protein [Gammaproteobacteria bacterium]
MKNLLVVPLVLLSICVIADERVILGSFERQTQETEFAEFGANFESIANGFGLQFLNFADSGFYFGAEFTRRTGDTETCVGAHCITKDSDFNHTVFSGTIGRSFGDWTPFVGASYNNTDSDGETVDGWGFDVGWWVRFDNLKFIGTVTNVDDDFSRGISTGFLFHMNKKWAVGAEIGTLLDSESDVFRFSLQLGRTF